MDIQDLILKIVQDTPIRMTAQQLIESQTGEHWVRVLLVDSDGNPVPVQYDTEGRLKMVGLQQDATSAYNTGYGDADKQHCAEFAHLGLDEHVKAGYHHSQLIAVAQLQHYNLHQAAQQAAVALESTRLHLVDDLVEPGRTVFWSSVNALAALAQVEVTP